MNDAALAEPEGLIQSKIDENGEARVALVFAPKRLGEAAPDLSHLQGVDLFDRAQIQALNSTSADVRGRADPGRTAGSTEGDFSFSAIKRDLETLGIRPHSPNDEQGFGPVKSNLRNPEDYIAYTSCRYAAFDHLVNFNNGSQTVTFRRGALEGTAEVFKRDDEVLARINGGSPVFVMRTLAERVHLGFILPIEGTLSGDDIVGTWTVDASPPLPELSYGTPGYYGPGAGSTPFNFSMRALVVDDIRSAPRPDLVDPVTNVATSQGAVFSARAHIIPQTSALPAIETYNNPRFEIDYKAEIFADGGEVVRTIYGLGGFGDVPLTVDWNGDMDGGGKAPGETVYGVKFTAMRDDSNNPDPKKAVGYLWTVEPGVGPPGVAQPDTGKLTISPNPYIPYTPEELVTSLDGDGNPVWPDDDGDGYPDRFPDHDGNGIPDFEAYEGPPDLKFTARTFRKGYKTSWFLNVYKEDGTEVTGPTQGPAPGPPWAGEGDVDVTWLDTPQDLEPQQLKFVLTVTRCRNQPNVQVLAQTTSTEVCQASEIVELITFGKSTLLLKWEKDSIPPSFLEQAEPVYSQGPESKTTAKVSWVGNREVKIKLSMVAIKNSGGHVDSLHAGERPLGTLQGIDGQYTMQPGQQRIFQYTAPNVGGEYKLKAELVDPPANSSGASATIAVKVPDLGRMEDDLPLDTRAVDLIGETSAHPDNHYGTTEMRQRLRDLYRRFYAISRDDPEYIDKRVWINDMSLPYGGQFSVPGDWLGTKSHVGHEKGVETDCGSEVVFPGRVRDLIFEIAAKDSGLHVHNETGGDLSHYHLVVDAKINPFPYVPPISP